MVQRIIVMMLFVTNMLSISYPQYMLISCPLKRSENTRIVDKVIEKKEDNISFDVVIPEINGLNNQEKEKEINSKINNYTEDWLNEIEEVAKEYFADGIEVSFPYEANSRYVVTRNDVNIISFYIDYYQFTGGAHGITRRVPYTIDVESGEVLEISSLFNDKFDYKSVIDNEIRRQINEEEDKYFDKGKMFKGIDDTQKFYISDSDLIIYFNQYEIAPYSAGIIEFNIPISLFEDNFIYF